MVGNSNLLEGVAAPISPLPVSCIAYGSEKKVFLNSTLNKAHFSNLSDPAFFFLNRPCLPSAKTEFLIKKPSIKFHKKYLFNSVYMLCSCPTTNCGPFSWDNPLHLMLITAFLSIFDPQVTGTLQYVPSWESHLMFSYPLTQVSLQANLEKLPSQ